MEKIKQLKEFIELKQLFGVPHISFVNVYDDPGLFYDYIGRDDQYFYNFCKITDINRGRYEHLIELNNKIVSDHYIPVLSFIKDNWYFERIQIFPINYFETPIDINLILSSVAKLNKDIQACDVDPRLVDNHKQFMKTHYKNLGRIFGKEFSQPNFIDMEKTFELSRMIVDGGIVKFTGAQSIHIGPSEYGTVSGILFSTYLDTDDNILEKFKIIDQPPSIVERILFGIKDQADTHKHTYVMDSNLLSMHFEKLGRLWKQFQLQA